MRKNSNQIHIFLSDADAAHLKRVVAASGLTQTAYIRQLIHGLIPQAMPPPEYHAMMEELYQIRSAFSELIAIAKSDGLDVQQYAEDARQLSNAIKRINDAVLLPRKAGA